MTAFALMASEIRARILDRGLALETMEMNLDPGARERHTRIT
jgi:hypothetical protein